MQKIKRLIYSDPALPSGLDPGIFNPNQGRKEGVFAVHGPCNLNVSTHKGVGTPCNSFGNPWHAVVTLMCKRPPWVVDPVFWKSPNPDPLLKSPDSDSGFLVAIIPLNLYL